MRYTLSLSGKPLVPIAPIKLICHKPQLIPVNQPKLGHLKNLARSPLRPILSIAIGKSLLRLVKSSS